MKFLIVFACLLVVALANEEAKVEEYKSEVNPEDFQYKLALSNSIKAEQSGVLKDKDNWVVEGQYEYVSKDGQHIKVHYTADESGYHPHIEKS